MTPRIDLTVADLSALAEVYAAEVEDGSNVWVTSANDYFTMHKNSGAPPDGVSIIAPLPGAPIAGNANARWIKIVPGGSVNSVTATLPIVSSGGANPNIAINPATPVTSGSLSAADKAKLDGISPGASVASVTGSAPIASSGGVNPNITISAATPVASGSMSAADKTKLDGLPASAVPTTRTLTAGAGLTGGGDLSADRTFDVVANVDGSIVANPNDVQVGVLATDAQHGVRGGGTQHALVVPAGAAGFMSGTDKATFDTMVALFVPSTRTLTAGAGLVGGGDLSADRTFDVVANADGSIVANANDIQVGVLATDAQHGVRGGGTQHALATTIVDGFMSATDKTKLDGIASGASLPMFFGDGADGPFGAATGAVTQPLTRATSYTTSGNVTPQATKNGLIIRATGTLTVTVGTSINANGLGTPGTAGGNNAASGVTQANTTQSQFVQSNTLTGPAGGTAGSGAGGTGNNGSAPSGGTQTQFQGGRGGGGGGGGGSTLVSGTNGGAGGAQAAGLAANFNDIQYARIRWDPIIFAGFTNSAAATTGVQINSGGAGGGGGGQGSGTTGGAPVTGGSGGAGGGFIHIAALAVAGTGTISANGTAGANGANGNAGVTNGGGSGGAGGGGGGGGGVVVIKTRSLGGGVVQQANGGGIGTGGTGGALAGAGGTGGNGASGESGAAGLVETVVLP